MIPRRGIALLEVVVALVVLAVGWVALLGLHRISLEIGLEADLADEARWSLQSIADSLDREPTSSGRRDFSWGWAEWAPESGGLLIVARAQEGDSIAELWSGVPR